MDTRSSARRRAGWALPIPPGAGANYLEIRVDDAISGVLALQEVKGPDTDPKLGSFGYVVEPRIFVGPDGRILNLGYVGDQVVVLIQRDSGLFWAGEDGKRVNIPAVNPPASPAAPTLRIADTRVVDLGLSVFWADRNVGADVPQAYGDYVPFGFEVPWGGGWRTPSYKEMEELVLKCSWELTACDGVKTALSGPRRATPRNTIWRITTSFSSR